MGSQLTVSIDPDLCCGSALCSVAVPEVFGLDRGGVVMLVGTGEGELSTEVPAALADRVLEAELACPANVIRVRAS